ncbi:hypothetical protein KIH87_09960 [Paraneptunicella aestuarii]|uniref:hypothetical protein n=1 Tax=Paraneptunicella aestuarii TaxID=2831148 RepID=UPI001E4F5E6B|nr:hypothetical protein [Paraneptunicella aestuarii]UAA40635.1 hypothetical protein KIH87_09960 [Paraneptunicella aestuarii]
MFDKKLQVEKVEMVKKIIRQNSYLNFDKSHKQCIELGIRVNRPALDNFGKKLKQLDLAKKPPNAKEQNSNRIHSGGEILEFKKPGSNGKSNVAIDIVSMTLEEAKQRETEITYELGELKIKENALLNELAVINKKFGL